MPERLKGFTTRRYINSRYLYLYTRNHLTKKLARNFAFMFDFLSHNTGVDTGVNTVRPSPLVRWSFFIFIFFLYFIYLYFYLRRLTRWPSNVHGQTTTSAINAYLTYRPTAGQQNTWLAPQWTAENIAKRISHFSLSCLTSYFHVTGTIDCLASPATSPIVNIDVPTYNAVHRPYILTPP